MNPVCVPTNPIPRVQRNRRTGRYQSTSKKVKCISVLEKLVIYGQALVAYEDELKRYFTKMHEWLEGAMYILIADRPAQTEPNHAPFNAMFAATDAILRNSNAIRATTICDAANMRYRLLPILKYAMIENRKFFQESIGMLSSTFDRYNEYIFWLCKAIQGIIYFPACMLPNEYGRIPVGLPREIGIRRAFTRRDFNRLLGADYPEPDLDDDNGDFVHMPAFFPQPPGGPPGFDGGPRNARRAPPDDDDDDDDDNDNRGTFRPAGQQQNGQQQQQQNGQQQQNAQNQNGQQQYPYQQWNPFQPLNTFQNVNLAGQRWQATQPGYNCASFYGCAPGLPYAVQSSFVTTRGIAMPNNGTVGAQGQGTQNDGGQNARPDAGQQNARPPSPASSTSSSSSEDSSEASTVHVRAVTSEGLETIGDRPRRTEPMRTPSTRSPSISSNRRTPAFTPASTPAFTPASTPAFTPAYTISSTPASTPNFAFTPFSTPNFVSDSASNEAFDDTPYSTHSFTPYSTPNITPRGQNTPSLVQTPGGLFSSPEGNFSPSSTPDITPMWQNTPDFAQTTPGGLFSSPDGNFSPSSTPNKTPLGQNTPAFVQTPSGLFSSPEGNFSPSSTPNATPLWQNTPGTTPLGQTPTNGGDFDYLSERSDDNDDFNFTTTRESSLAVIPEENEEEEEEVAELINFEATSSKVPTEAEIDIRKASRLQNTYVKGKNKKRKRRRLLASETETSDEEEEIFVRKKKRVRVLPDTDDEVEEPATAAAVSLRAALKQQESVQTRGRIAQEADARSASTNIASVAIRETEAERATEMEYDAFEEEEEQQQQLGEGGDPYDALKLNYQPNHPIYIFIEKVKNVPDENLREVPPGSASREATEIFTHFAETNTRATDEQLLTVSSKLKAVPPALLSNMLFESVQESRLMNSRPPLKLKNRSSKKPDFELGIKVYTRHGENLLRVAGDAVFFDFESARIDLTRIVGQIGPSVYGVILRNAEHAKTVTLALPKTNALVSYKKHSWNDFNPLTPNERKPPLNSEMLVNIALPPFGIVNSAAARMLTREGFKVVKNLASIYWNIDISSLSYEVYVDSVLGLKIESLKRHFKNLTDRIGRLANSTRVRNFPNASPDVLLRNPYPLFDFEILFLLRTIYERFKDLRLSWVIINEIRMELFTDRKAKAAKPPRFSLFLQKHTKKYTALRLVVINVMTAKDLQRIFSYA